ncbi:alpha-L-fucosidase [Mytilus galloprovincialis]|uniref:alpha-L-fucosidase n=1 Tax=Mytilus galloprovincialis TaxID=29158 RepID=A0A8B6HNF5_MYTGA|nr:alpha-L-fucosidase [Mytilus galloprovincialis]
MVQNQQVPYQQMSDLDPSRRSWNRTKINPGISRGLYVRKGKQGFGLTSKPRLDTADRKQKRPDLAQQEIHQKEEEIRNLKAVGMTYPVKDTVVTNDRWGSGCSCKHGGFYTCSDRYNPGKLQKHKWENAMTIDKFSWGYRRNARLEDYLTIEDLLKQFISTVSCGGNMLMNVGPTKYGKISPIYEERLRQMGQWLRVNGDGIYATRPWVHQNDTVVKNVWYTMKKGATETDVYAILLEWPDSNLVKLGAPITSKDTTVSMLGYPDKVTWTAGAGGKGINIQIPPLSVETMPCEWAWTFKMTGLQN